MMKKIVGVTPLKNKRLRVTFSDGITGIFDVTPYIKSDFFKKLEDDQYFNEVRIFFTGVGWPEGQDLGPDTIEAEMQPLDKGDLAAE
jgi:hypothetical protein